MNMEELVPMRKALNRASVPPPLLTTVCPPPENSSDLHWWHPDRHRWLKGEMGGGEGTSVVTSAETAQTAQPAGGSGEVKALLQETAPVKSVKVEQDQKAGEGAAGARQPASGNAED